MDNKSEELDNMLQDMEVGEEKLFHVIDYEIPQVQTSVLCVHGGWIFWRMHFNGNADAVRSSGVFVPLSTDG